MISERRALYHFKAHNLNELYWIKICRFGKIMEKISRISIKLFQCIIKYSVAINFKFFRHQWKK